MEQPARMGPAQSPRIPAWAIGLAVLALYAGLATAHLRIARSDVTALIVAGDMFTNRDRLDRPIRILPNSAGYDGQFYYRLALDPFTSEQTAHGITIDNPATRGARILYPLLAWATSLGRPAFVPRALLAVNLLGLVALAWIGVTVARQHGAPAWMGVLPTLYPGFIVTILRDTTEVTAAVPELAAVAFALRGRAWPAALCGAVAVLARETALFALAGFGIVELFRCVRARRISPALVAYMLPAAAFVAWQVAILWHWHLTSFSGTSQNLGPPLAGIVRFVATEVHAAVQATGSRIFRLHLYWLAAAFMCFATVAIVAALAVRREAPTALVLSWALYAGLMLCLTTAIWVEPYDFLRACTEVFLLGATVVMVSRNRVSGLTLLVLTVPVWAVGAVLL